MRCIDAAVSGSFFFLSSVVEANAVERAFGSFGVGFHRSGCAICASNVSYGKNWAFGRPIKIY